MTMRSRAFPPLGYTAVYVVLSFALITLGLM